VSAQPLQSVLPSLPSVQNDGAGIFPGSGLTSGSNPRHAWWRDLKWFPGSKEGLHHGKTRVKSGSSGGVLVLPPTSPPTSPPSSMPAWPGNGPLSPREQDPEVGSSSSGTDQAVAPPPSPSAGSCALPGVGPAAGTTGSTTAGWGGATGSRGATSNDLAPLKTQPSEHLKWAKHVSSLQSEWLREHRALMKPQKPAGKGTRGNGDRWLKKTAPMVMRDPTESSSSSCKVPPQRPEAPDFDWSRNLREESGSDTRSANNKTSFKIRKERALQQVKAFQNQWRQEQKQEPSPPSGRRGKENLSLADRSSCGQGSGSSGQPSSGQRSSGQRLSGGSPSICDACEDYEPLPFIRSSAAHSRLSSRKSSEYSCARSNNISLLLESVGSLDSRLISSRNSLVDHSDSPSSPSSFSESSEGESPKSLHKSPRGGQKHIDLNEHNTSSSDESADKGYTRRSSTSKNSKTSSRMTSGRSSMSDVGGVGGNQPGLITELFTSDGELVGNWTPSYVSSNNSRHTSHTSSSYSSKRASMVRSSSSDSLQAPIFEEPNPGSPIPEEDVGGQKQGGAVGNPRTHHKVARQRKTRRKEREKEALWEMEQHVESWQQWFTDFPKRALDELANAYEAFPRSQAGAESAREVRLGEIIQITTKVLGFPGEAITAEALARGLILSGTSEERQISFPSLTGFLELVRGTVDRVQLESAERLWSTEDLNHISSVFSRHAHPTTKMLPMSKLFKAIEELDFDDLRASTSDQQRFLAGITHGVMESSKFLDASPPSSPRRKTCVGGVDVALADVIRVITAALREKERMRRKEEFLSEQRSRRGAGFTTLEAEDLRELHETYLAQQVPEKAHSFERLSLFFESCGVRDLTASERQACKDILAKHLPGEGRSATFTEFMFIMMEVFAQSIGELRWSGGGGLITLPELHGRKGFAAEMLREYLYVVCHTASSSATHTRRGSSMEITPLSSRRNSGMRKVNSGDRRPSRSPNSRAGSRGVSRSASMKGVVDKVSKVAEVDEEVSSKKDPAVKDPVDRTVMNLKGLPPSEAMLSRKQFRACSVDLTDTLPQVVPDSRASSRAAHREPPRAHASLAEIVPPGPPKGDTTAASPTKRKVKPVLDSLTIVTDAISKLSEMEFRRDFGDEEEGEDHGGGDMGEEGREA